MPSSYLNHYSDNQARVNEQAILIGGQNAISNQITALSVITNNIVSTITAIPSVNYSSRFNSVDNTIAQVPKNTYNAQLTRIEGFPGIATSNQLATNENNAIARQAILVGGIANQPTYNSQFNALSGQIASAETNAQSRQAIVVNGIANAEANAQSRHNVQLVAIAGLVGTITLLCPYTSNGGIGGILWALGTQAGITAYVNPAPAIVQISHSGFISGAAFANCTDRNTGTGQAISTGISAQLWLTFNGSSPNRKVRASRITIHSNSAATIEIRASNSGQIGMNYTTIATGNLVANNWASFAITTDTYFSTWGFSYSGSFTINEIEVYGWVSNF